MKKLLLVLGTIGLSSAAYADLPQPQATNDFSYSVSLGAYVVNDTIPQNLLKSVLEPKGQVRAKYKNNLYAEAGVKLDNDNYGDYSLTVGAAQSEGLIRPFVEMNTHFVRNAHTLTQTSTDEDGQEVVTTTTTHEYIEKVGYAAGLSVFVNDYIQPYVKVNNFADEHGASITAGSHFKINNEFGCDFSLDYGPHHNWHNVNVAATYNF